MKNNRIWFIVGTIVVMVALFFVCFNPFDNTARGQAVVKVYSYLPIVNSDFVRQDQPTCTELLHLTLIDDTELINSPVLMEQWPGLTLGVVMMGYNQPVQLWLSDNVSFWTPDNRLTNIRIDGANVPTHNLPLTPRYELVGANDGSSLIKSGQMYTLHLSYSGADTGYYPCVFKLDMYWDALSPSSSSLSSPLAIPSIVLEANDGN